MSTINNNELKIDTDAIFEGPFYQVETDKIWVTQISRIKLEGQSSLKFHLRRPESGDASGGWVTLWKDEITDHSIPVLTQYEAGRDSKEITIKSDSIDFTKHNYILGYGPEFHKGQAKIIATSVKILFGSPIGLKLSACSPISDEVNSITAAFRLDANKRGFGAFGAWISVREGAVFGEGKEIGVNGIPHYGPSTGIQNVALSEPLKAGQTYNVVAKLEAGNRPIAGYSFRRAF